MKGRYDRHARTLVRDTAMRAMYLDSRMSIAQIAVAWCCSSGCVEKVLKRLAVPMRPQGRTKRSLPQSESTL